MGRPKQVMQMLPKPVTLKVPTRPAIGYAEAEGSAPIG
jgi:hypothetical protein